MIQGCLFDMDGVLLDSERFGMAIFPKIAASHGYQFPPELYLKMLGLDPETSKKIVQQVIGADFPHTTAMMELFEALLLHAESGTLPLKPGLSACLQGLKARGLRLALVTSTRRDVVLRYLKAIPEFHNAFDAVACGSDVAQSKPAPDIFLLAAKALGLSPAECIGIEDSRNGLKSLRAAGIPAVMIPDLLPCDDSFAGLVDWKLDSLAELCPLVDKLNAPSS